MSELDLDPRWEWIHAPSWSDPDLYVRGRCNHLKVETVHNLDGEVVALLCPTCDKHWYSGRTLDRT